MASSISVVQIPKQDITPPAPITSHTETTSTKPSQKGRTIQTKPTPFQTVVFSRKTTYHGPEEASEAFKKQTLNESKPSPLASLVHQTDRYGKQAEIIVPNAHQHTNLKIRPVERNSSSGISKLFSNICSALGIEQQQQLQQQQAKETNKKQTEIRETTPIRKSIITKPHPNDIGKKCLVLDLDETLVHSSFKPIPKPDYIIPVEIEGHVHQVYVLKRPGVDEFMKEMAKYYEIVVYTASLSKYADPLLDQLDTTKVIRHRLFREHCVHYEGSYVKDLSLLDREITQTIIIDNSPMSYLFHPRNAIGCTSFIDDMEDRELYSINEFLIKIANVEDIRNHVHLWTPHS